MKKMISTLSFIMVIVIIYVVGLQYTEGKYGAFLPEKPQLYQAPAALAFLYRPYYKAKHFIKENPLKTQLKEIESKKTSENAQTLEILNSGSLDGVKAGK